VSASLAARGLANTDELPARTRTNLANFLRDVDRWRSLVETTPHPRLLETILEESGYTDMLRLDRTPTAQTRLENLKELVQSMAAFDTLEAYLEHVSLVMDLDRGAGDDAVQVMTLHGAKGLEFPLVFLPGWEEGVFPSQRSIDEKGEKGLEEERRLAYVAITRARRKATVMHAANRRIYGQWTSSIPSRFLGELPKPHIEEETTMTGGESLWRAQWSERADPFAHVARPSRGPGWQRATRTSYSAEPARVIEARGSAVSLGNQGRTDLALGQRVFHGKFGYGIIAAIEGNKLEIDFEHAGRKKVIDSFVSAS
jgi:DNA helicase-2/ATP-dependent DNA helicase PcrA